MAETRTERVAPVRAPAATEAVSASRVDKSWRLAVAFFAVFALLFTQAACEDEVIESEPPPKQQGDQQNNRRRSRGAAAEKPKEEEKADPNAGFSPMIGERPTVSGRDPFFGFVDELIAERARLEEEAARMAAELEEEELQPAQRFDTLQFQLVAIVSETGAGNKALLIDPNGTAHLLRQGALIGKKNGVIVKIDRDQILIVQGEDFEEGERVVMKLHPDLPPGMFIDVR